VHVYSPKDKGLQGYFVACGSALAFVVKGSAGFIPIDYRLLIIDYDP